MGNSSNKQKHVNHRQFSSQHNLSDFLNHRFHISRSTSCEFVRPWSRFSRRSWTTETLNNPLQSSKTAWPVPRCEAIFLPEFEIKENPIKKDYVFLDYIAEGSYGHVYKVKKRDTGEIFALKVISKAKIVAEDGITQSKLEVPILRSIGRFPFIAYSPHHWQGRKKLYILTEYIGGGEMYSLVEEYSHCGIPEEVVRIYVAEMALALDFLHKRGIIHRDLKASNVLLDRDGHAVLIDFGYAKWLGFGQKTGTFCGTLNFMAPEILTNEMYDHSVDWWALGVLTCVMLTARYPARPRCEHDAVKNNDMIDTIESASDVTPGTLPSNAENLSSAVKDLLKRLLQPNPKMRLHSLLELQRIAFYMGYDLNSYMDKKVSPFQLLNRKVANTSSITSINEDFSDFDSVIW